MRRDRHGGYAICISNFTPVTREHYRIGLPDRRAFKTGINTDDSKYGGSGVGPGDLIVTDDEHHGRPHSMNLCLPPLATLILTAAD